MCGVGAKSVAHFMKFHLLQSEVVEVKVLMNSIMTLTMLNLHQKTDPKVQQDFKGQSHNNKVKGQIKVTPCYSFQDIARTRFYRSRSLRQGQIKVTS